MKQQNKIFSNNLCHAIFTLARCANSQLFKIRDSLTLFITPFFHLERIFAIKKIFMSPGKLVDEKGVGCQDKSGPGKIHEVILVHSKLFQALECVIPSLSTQFY